MFFPVGRWLIVFALTLLACPLASAGIMNGDFSDTNGLPFADWSTLYGDAPTDAGGIAMFEVTDFFHDVQLEQTFLLPAGATELSFEFLLSSATGGDDLGFFDSFQVSLFDAFGGPLLSIDPGNPFDPRFYGLDSSGVEIKSAQVSVVPFQVGADTWNRVNLGVSSLASQTLTIEFLLLGDDDGLTTTILLDNVRVTGSIGAVPEPTNLVIWGGLACLALGCRRRTLNMNIA